MHLHLPHLPVPAVLLSVLYVAAVAVALAHPGAHTLAGLVVLAGLVGRRTVVDSGEEHQPRRHRHRHQRR